MLTAHCGFSARTVMNREKVLVQSDYQKLSQSQREQGPDSAETSRGLVTAAPREQVDVTLQKNSAENEKLGDNPI